ncbi:MAG: hypothetical protein IPP48_09150 [Chitinophagaceae bacterium]|nr:hypothetical protein [Chitinophagaceae bacterium]
MVTLLSGFTNAPLGGLAIDNLINIYNAPTVTSSKNIVSFDEISWSGISQSAFELATKGYQNLQERGCLKKAIFLL